MKRLLVLALLAGCSSGGGGDEVTGGVTRADYLKAAETICAAANDEQDALKTPTDVKDLAGYVAKVVDIADRATRQLEALPAPKNDEADLKAKVFDRLDAQLVVAKDYSAQVEAAKDDNVALAKLFVDPPTETKADLFWMRDYGFDECVEAADTGS